MTWAYIEDVDERHAPPTEPLLRLKVVGDDLLSVAIVKPDQDREQAYEEVAQVIVPLAGVKFAISGQQADRFTRLREREA